MSDLIEAVARAIDPEAWAEDLPIPTRAHTIAFHEGRAKSIAKAPAALAALRETLEPVGWRYSDNDEPDRVLLLHRQAPYLAAAGFTEVALYALEKRHD